MTLNYTTTLFVSAFILTLLWVVSGIIVVLTLLRRRRHPYYTNPVQGVNHKQTAATFDDTKAGVVQTREGAKPLMMADVRADALPEKWRLPVQDGTPDQVVIHIEPDGTPSQDQTNIRRLIHHLQQLPKKAS